LYLTWVSKDNTGPNDGMSTVNPVHEEEEHITPEYSLKYIASDQNARRSMVNISQMRSLQSGQMTGSAKNLDLHSRCGKEEVSEVRRVRMADWIDESSIARIAQTRIWSLTGLKDPRGNKLSSSK